jgi:predicted NUDIX family NTP pyrophosphohydrolase
VIKKSAGLLMVRRRATLEVLLAHPGGPFWAKKDEGAWSIPKGELEPGEDGLAAAQRELTEETGFVAMPPFHSLGAVKQKSGKIVEAWAFEGDADPAAVKSNLITIEWPPRSGKRIEIPEIDRVAWLSLDEARIKINPAQASFLDAVAELF